ncbi:MAG TPA: DUF2442 domain-containing protein [Pyrinomonadaceae bacterium]|jgi:hypothetical protein
MISRTFEEQYEHAKRAGEQANQSEPRAESAYYDSRKKRIIVRLRNGENFSFSPEWVPGLRMASPSDLANIEISPSGAGLHWESLDEDLSVPALLQGIFGPVDDNRIYLPISTELFESLCAQIEVAWGVRRDATLVELIAAEYPQYSADLYDFFALLVESELAAPESEGFRQSAEKIKDWLQSEGFEIAREIAREQRNQTLKATPIQSTESEAQLSENENQNEERHKTNQLSQPLGYIGLAQKQTGLEVEEIEKRMGVPALVIKFTQRQPSNKLRPIRREIIKRGKRIGIEESEGEEALNFQIQRAAKRGVKKKSLVSKSVTEQFKELIEQIPVSKMSNEEKDYWIKLSHDEEN